MPKYFECKPRILCGGADCCTSIDTEPELTLGDFFRLSRFTQESIVDIWKTKGNIALKRFSDPLLERQYVISLGLLHDPCPYLKDYRCSIHSQKPVNCSGFPLLAEEVIVRKNDPCRERWKNYRCLQDLIPRPGEKEIREKLRDIRSEENFLDELFLWDGNLQRVEIVTGQDYINLVVKAVEAQAKKDPSFKNKRSQRIKEAVDTMPRLITSTDEALRIHHLQNVMYTILEDEIIKRLRRVEQYKGEYEETTRRYLEILTQIN